MSWGTFNQFWFFYASSFSSYKPTIDVEMGQTNNTAFEEGHINDNIILIFDEWHQMHKL